MRLGRTEGRLSVTLLLPGGPYYSPMKEVNALLRVPSLDAKAPLDMRVLSTEPRDGFNSADR